MCLCRRGRLGGHGKKGLVRSRKGLLLCVLRQYPCDLFFSRKMVFFSWMVCVGALDALSRAVLTEVCILLASCLVSIC